MVIKAGINDNRGRADVPRQGPDVALGLLVERHFEDITEIQ
jgi:hypothetical protein